MYRKHQIGRTARKNPQNIKDTTIQREGRNRLVAQLHSHDDYAGNKGKEKTQMTRAKKANIDLRRQMK